MTSPLGLSEQIGEEFDIAFEPETDETTGKAEALSDVDRASYIINSQPGIYLWGISGGFKTDS